jgi:hypothetical protein
MVLEQNERSQLP